MTFNYSLLAFNWELLSQVLAFLMLASLAVGCVIGFTQGFRRIHWGGVAWALAAGSYSAVLAIAQEKMQSSGLVSYLIAAVACALVCLVGFAVLRLIIKPRKAKELNERNLHNYLREEDELREMERKELEKCQKYAPEDLDELRDEQARRRKKYRKKMQGKIRLSDRILGAIIVGIDARFLVGMAVNMGLVIVNALPSVAFLDGFRATVGYYQLLEKAQAMVLDYLLIGVLMFAMWKGYQNGVLKTFYGLFASLGALAAAGVAFYIPFTSLVEEGKIFSLIGAISETVGNAASGFLPEAVASFAPTIGKIGGGIVLCVVFVLIASFISKGIRKVAEYSLNHPVFHVWDGALGIVMGLAVASLIIGAVLAFFAASEIFGLYPSSELLTPGTTLFKTCYDKVFEIANSFLGKYIG